MPAWATTVCNRDHGGMGEEASCLAQGGTADADGLRGIGGVHRQAFVPGVEDGRFREFGHDFAIAGGHPLRELAPGLPAQDVEGGHHEAGGETLEVPFPGRDRGFVEVVYIEHQPALGRRETAEVEAMTVAARLDPQAAAGCARQVGRHYGGAPAQEGEGRDLHAGIAQRQQFLQPRPALFDQHVDGVAAVAGGRPRGMASALATPAQVAAERNAVSDRQGVGLYRQRAGCVRLGHACLMARGAAGCRPCRPLPRACQFVCD